MITSFVLFFFNQLKNLLFKMGRIGWICHEIVLLSFFSGWWGEGRIKVAKNEFQILNLYFDDT